MATEFASLIARSDKFQTDNAALPPAQRGGSETTRCQPNNRGTQPTLAEMTSKALDLLEDDPDGFALQVEGASIDKRDHAADACGQIGELLGFDEAMGVALEFQREHPDTLIVMTADHAHTSEIINSDAKPATGASYATLQTVDGAPIRVAYTTGDPETGRDQSHTGAEVPVWASGPQAANIQGTIDQTDIFDVLIGKTPSRIPGAGIPGPQGPGGEDGAPGENGQDGAGRSERRSRHARPEWCSGYPRPERRTRCSGRGRQRRCRGQRRRPGPRWSRRSSRQSQRRHLRAEERQQGRLHRARRNRRCPGPTRPQRPHRGQRRRRPRGTRSPPSPR